jgi:hypothetical protein
MEITGKIIQKLELQQGTSKAGKAWSKQEYVLETIENFPKKVHFDFFGERANQYPLEVGDTIKLSFDLESREWNGKWFTSVHGWKAEQVDPAAANAPAATPVAPAASTPVPNAIPAPTVPDFGAAEGENDDLPF